MYSRKKHARVFLTAMACTAMIACAPVKEDVKEELPKLVVGPEEAPTRSITNFSSALRCMDNLMIEYGVYDISILLEDVRDNTDKVKVGAKDMMISAISEMTRRSHAVRLIAYGNDSGNLVSFLATANQTTAYQVIPQYGIRGSISQLDKSVAAKDVAGGLNFSGVGIGGAKTANASVMGLDLAILNTSDFSVIPGVISKNSIVIFKEGKGVDADASIGKFGVNFSMNLTRAEGDAQALRNLVELATVELIGKLTKTPYWSCLNIDGDRPEIRDEMSDWYYNLVADQKVVEYFQLHLTNRGFYSGPIDGQYNAGLTAAISDYQRGLGLEPNGNINRELFDGLLNKPVPTLSEKTVVVQEKPAEAVPLTISYAGKSRQALSRGEQFSVNIRPSSDAHVFCYFASEDGSIQRFFPNRFTTDARVKASAPLNLPGEMPFKLYASKNGKNERMACFTSPKPVMAVLPYEAKGTDFENLPMKSLEQVEAALKGVVGNELGGQYFEIVVQ